MCRRGHPRPPNLKQARMDQERDQNTRGDSESSRGVVTTVTSIFGPVVANVHLYMSASTQFHWSMFSSLVAETCGVRSTGCWLVSGSRCVYLLGRCAPCVWISTPVPPHTDPLPARSSNPVKHLQHHRLKKSRRTHPGPGAPLRAGSTQPNRKCQETRDKKSQHQKTLHPSSGREIEGRGKQERHHQDRPLSSHQTAESWIQFEPSTV